MDKKKDFKNSRSPDSKSSIFATITTQNDHVTNVWQHMTYRPLINSLVSLRFFICQPAFCISIHPWIQGNAQEFQIELLMSNSLNSLDIGLSFSVVIIWVVNNNFMLVTRLTTLYIFSAFLSCQKDINICTTNRFCSGHLFFFAWKHDHIFIFIQIDI